MNATMSRQKTRSRDQAVEVPLNHLVLRVVEQTSEPNFFGRTCLVKSYTATLPEVFCCLLELLRVRKGSRLVPS